MLAATVLAVLVRVVPATSDGAPAHVVIALDQQRTLRVATNSVVDCGEAKQIEITDRAWWSPVVATADKQQVDVPVWPAVELKGQLLVEKGSSAPRELSATFELNRERITVACRVDANAWNCRLPRTTLDIRLAAPHFAPHYLWSIDLSKARPLSIALKRGGSVAGWVSAAEDGAALDAATVRVTPMTYDESASGSLQSFAAKPNKRGFFQLTGIPAGRWVVVAEAETLSPSAVSEIEVDDRNETLLRDALLLRPLADLAVSIQPEIYARGVPWRVRLNRRDPRSRYQQFVAESAANEAGEWRHPRLPAGEYDLDILNSRGAVFGSRRIVVTFDMAPVEIEIDRLSVRGTLRIGGNGVAATLKFSSGRGESLSTTSKDDGDFNLQLPFEGKWRVDVRLRDTGQELSPPAVKIARKEGEPHVRLDLDLPGGRIAGRVVDASGRSTKAGVILTRNGSLLADILAENGAFELVGVEPGPATIEANTKDGSSGIVPVNIDIQASPVTLAIRPRIKLEAFVITSSGDPVAGASVRFHEQGAAFLGEVVTSPTGRFVIEVSPNTAAVRVAIIAPGLPTKLALLQVPEAKEPIDVVVGRASGRLIVRSHTPVPPWPRLSRDGASAPLFHLFPPFYGGGQPPWATKDGTAFDLEPGEYTICSTQCATHLVAAGTTTIAEVP